MHKSPSSQPVLCNFEPPVPQLMGFDAGFYHKSSKSCPDCDQQFSLCTFSKHVQSLFTALSSRSVKAASAGRMAAPSVPRQSHHLYLVFKLFTPEEEILVLDFSFPILSHPDYFDFRVVFFYFFCLFCLVWFCYFAQMSCMCFFSFGSFI